MYIECCLAVCPKGADDWRRKGHHYSLKNKESTFYCLSASSQTFVTLSPFSYWLFGFNGKVGNGGNSCGNSVGLRHKRRWHPVEHKGELQSILFCPQTVFWGEVIAELFWAKTGFYCSSPKASQLSLKALPDPFEPSPPGLIWDSDEQTDGRTNGDREIQGDSKSACDSRWMTSGNSC